MLVLRPTQLPIRWVTESGVKQLGHETEHSHPIVASLRMPWSRRYAFKLGSPVISCTENSCLMGYGCL